MSDSHASFLVVQPDDLALVVDKANTFLTAAESMQVTTLEESTIAVATVKKIKAKYKELEAERKTITGPLDVAKKNAMNIYRGPIDYLKKAEDIIRGKVTQHSLAVEKQEREAQAKADEAARKERNRIQKRAEAAKEKGQDEKADMLDAHAEVVAAPVVVAEKAKGQSIKKTWIGEVDDLQALCKAIGEGRAPVAMVQVSQSDLNSYARGTKGQMKLDGVTFREKATSAFR